MDSQILVEVINSFASQQTNPVLSILPDGGVIEYDSKYPPNKLNFNGDCLRAYYHCHSANNHYEAEHGHFHIFIKTSGGQWCHLAGLSMDEFGQPVRWFTVNHWVTGESWCGSEVILTAIKSITVSDELKLTESWLLVMMQFYKSVLSKLLTERDLKLVSLCDSRNTLNSVLQDHEIYELSSAGIFLLNDLKQAAETLTGITLD